MRLWSIHPKYLDSKGLVALWRETLLAKNVLENKTKGYKNHPQLFRFKELENPVSAINQYLSEIYKEAQNRQYHFDENKIDWKFFPVTIQVTQGQIEFEMEHLLKKLKVRDLKKFSGNNGVTNPDTFEIFEVVEGTIEEWEIL